MVSDIGIKAEYNMGALDYERFHEYLKMCDAWRMKVILKKANARDLREFYAMLETLHTNLKSAYIHDTERIQKINKLAKSIEDSLIQLDRDSTGKTQQIPVDIVMKLREMHTELLHVRQILGVGFPVSRVFGAKQKLEMMTPTRKKSHGGLNVRSDDD